VNDTELSLTRKNGAATGAAFTGTSAASAAAREAAKAIASAGAVELKRV
jgi:hypothetical protein